MITKGTGKFAYREHEQIYPQPGWIEHDPSEIWEKLEIVANEALDRADLTADDLVSIGITNQRETVFTWNQDGEPLHNGIVWQDSGPPTGARNSKGRRSRVRYWRRPDCGSTLTFPERR